MAPVSRLIALSSGLSVTPHCEDGADDKIHNSFFHNKGGGKFEETSFGTGVALPEDGQFVSGMGTAARDPERRQAGHRNFVALDH
jgi:enediyne biosynthesis protein E4